MSRLSTLSHRHLLTAGGVFGMAADALLIEIAKLPKVGAQRPDRG